MNKAAEKHLAKARDYVARGEAFYRKAAEEIVAAQEADPTLGQRELAHWFGRSKTWVQSVVSWSTSGQGTDQALPFSEPKGEVAKRHTRSVLRETPDIVTDLTPDEQRAISRKLDEEAGKRQAERKAEAKRKEREHLGDEVVDDLELREELQTTEYLLIKARGELRGFIKQFSEIGYDNTPELWRESCLDWIKDLDGHLAMARALLSDETIIDMTAFEEMLKDA